MATIKWRAGGTRPATINKNLFISLGFVPTSIAGCTLWLDSTDSDSITFSSGSNVGQWRDKSGAGNHFGTVAGTVTRITDGSFSVINIASGGIMSSANQITFTGSSAFFIVSKITGVANWGNMLLGFTDINGGDKSIRFEQYVLRGTGGNGDGNDLANGTYYVNGTLNPSFGSSTYFNVYFIIGTVAPQSGGTSFITFSSSFMGRYFIGNIAEFLFYPGGVTSTQRQNIESYLAQKWGLTASLPLGHLHLTQPVSLISTPAINPGRFFKRTIFVRVPVEYVTTLTYTGSLRTFVVPAEVTSVRLYMWGAGGGTSYAVGGFVNYSGGAGAMVQGVYAVTPGSTLYVVVGKGGVTNQSLQSDAQGGGGAANSAGGGGGRSAIQLTAGGADVVVAGGGGGAGLLYANNNGTGGPAYFSGSSPNTLAAVVGYGGTQTAGGAGGGNGGGAGSLKFGGAGTGPGAGGGGGYYGGGGMGNGDQGWCPGGGGSSLIDNLTLIPGQTVFGYNSPNLSGAPNTSSPYYQSNIAAGGVGANATGGNGLVVIVYYI